MKRPLKIGLSVISIIIIVLLFLSVLYMVKFKSETKKMAPSETGKIVDNIYSVRDSFVNLFLLKDSDRYIAVDAGNNLKTIAAELKKLNIDPDKITAILLTHTHGDHVAAIRLFRNARVYLSAQEEQMINGETPVFLWFGNKIAAKDYSLLNNNQVFNIGNIKIRAILTPGHTPGSMCYLINDKYLFAGDEISIKAGKIAGFNEYFNMDSKAAIKSMHSILNLPSCRYIFSSHYGYTDDYQTAVKDFREP